MTAATTLAVAALLAGCSSGSSSSSTSNGGSGSKTSSGPVSIGIDLTYNNTVFWAAYTNYEKRYAAPKSSS